MTVESFASFCVARCCRLLQQRGWQLVPDRQHFCQQLCVNLAESATAPSSAQWERLVRGRVRLRYSQVLHRCCGDPEQQQNRAFEELAAYLYGIARQKLSDLEVIKDVTQTSLERIFQHYHSCRTPASFLAWCVQILINATYNHHREEMRWRVKGETGQEQAGKLSLERLIEERGKQPRVEGLTPEQLAELRDLQSGLVELIRQHLPGAKQQIVAILSFVYGWKPREIAEALDVPAYQVRLNKSKALQCLKEDPQFRQELAQILAYRA